MNIRRQNGIRLVMTSSQQGINMLVLLVNSVNTGWPNKNRTFFEIPYFCSQYIYNHAVFAEVFRNYRGKQQATIFLNKC